MLDEMLKYRISRVTEAKKPIYTPRLKVHKLFGEKKMLSLNVGRADRSSTSPSRET